MVVIFSKVNDASTIDVINWIRYMGHEVIRINASDSKTKFKRINLLQNEIIFEVEDGQEINLLCAQSVWFRRNGIGYRMFDLKLIFSQISTIFLDEGMENYVHNHIKKEIDVIIDNIYYLLESNCRTLGSYFNAELNKLNVLYLAKKIGLLIPSTYVVDQKNEIIELLDQHPNGIITKALSDGIYWTGAKNAYYTYTERLDKDFLKNLKRRFCYSLIQAEIAKKIEIRSFFLDGALYSMAIFSQSNSQTNIDFRKYDNEVPNRVVPFQLPDYIERALKELMNILHLNTGSIDLILDKSGQYYFLEINPVGQFGMVSQPCNYYLEKKVAEFLINTI